MYSKKKFKGVTIFGLLSVLVTLAIVPILRGSGFPKQEPASSELGFSSQSPLGSIGGSSLPASCESGYSHDAGVTDCTIAFTANPPTLSLGSGQGVVLNWNFRNTSPIDGYSNNGPGQAYYSYFNSPYFCTITGPGLGGGTGSQTFWYPSSVTGSLATPVINSTTGYSISCRAAGGLSPVYYPAAGFYYDYTNTVTVPVLAPPDIKKFYTVPVVIYAGTNFFTRWYLGDSVTGCDTVSMTPAVNNWPAAGTALSTSNTPITSGPDQGSSIWRAYSPLNLVAPIPGTYTVTLSCHNGGGATIMRTDTFDVLPTPPAAITYLTATPSVVDAGGTSMVSWTSQYTNACYEAGDSHIAPAYRNPSTGDATAISNWKIQISVSPSSLAATTRVSPIATPVTLKLACFDLTFNVNTGRSNITGLAEAPQANASVTIDVKGITLSASPNTFPSVSASNNSTLTWTINAAREQSCAATSNPSIAAWDNPNLPISNSSLVVNSIGAVTDFTITCQKTVAAGGGSESVTARVNVGGPRIYNFNYIPSPTAVVYGTPPQAVTYEASPDTAFITVKMSGLNKFVPMSGAVTVADTASPSTAPRWNLSQGSLVYNYATRVIITPVFGVTNIFGIANGVPLIPAPTQKTTYTLTMTPYTAAWVAGVPAVTTVDVYPANPVTIREGRSHLNGTNYNAPKTLPGGDPTQNISVNIFAGENGTYPTGIPGIVDAPTAYFKFDAGPNAKECYITRNNSLVAIISNPNPTDNTYYPSVFSPAPDAASSLTPGINDTNFIMSCYYTNGTVRTSTNTITFTYPPYASGVTAACDLNATVPQLTFNYNLAAGISSASVRAYAVPGGPVSACAPTSTPQTTGGGAYCDTVAGVSGANTYVVPNASPAILPSASPTHPAPLIDTKYNYWVQSLDQFGNWGDISPWGATTDSSHRVFCAGPPNQIPVAIVDVPAVPITKNSTDTITFTGHGTDPDVGDTIARYYFAYFDTLNTKHILLDTLVSNTIVGGGIPAATLTTTLPIGVYTAGTASGIYFVVQDSRGEWSNKVYVPTLTVTPLPFSVTLTANPTTPNPQTPITLSWTVNNGPADTCTASITRSGVAADGGSAWVSPLADKAPTGGSQSGIIVPNMPTGVVQRYTITCVQAGVTQTASVDITSKFKKGDGVCEGSKGENVVNSPIDCKNGSYHETVL